jgi:hypothetical protein
MKQVKHIEVMGGRTGTVRASQVELEAIFGKPVVPDCSDGKVTKAWYFETSHGGVELRDYWWNGPEEWSIATASDEATIEAIKHFQSLGLAADNN